MLTLIDLTAKVAAVGRVGKNNRRALSFGRRSAEEPLAKRVAVSFAHLCMLHTIDSD